MTFLYNVLIIVINDVVSSPISTLIRLSVLELGFFTTPEFFSDPSTNVKPVSTSSSFNKIIRSDEDLIRKATLVTGHSVKLGFMLGLWACVAIGAVLIKG